MGRVRLSGVMALLGAAIATAQAADVPVAGRKLLLRAPAAAAKRRAVIELRDPAIGPPFDDPRTTGATLRLNGGAATGQCFVSVALPATGWSAAGRDGVQRGFKWTAPAPGQSGVRRITIRPGSIVIRASGPAWPCPLTAVAQRLPATVVLGSGSTHFCAAFGGPAQTNAAGRLFVRGAPAPATCPEHDLTVADLNVLHGLFCPAGTASCRAADRFALLFAWLAAAGCPDLVTLQEMWVTNVPLLTAALPGPCGYQLIYQTTNGVDDPSVLTRHPVVSSAVTNLYKGFRNMMHVRVDHPLGPIDVFTTHLASSSDGAQLPCAGDCPSECVAAGATTVRECQGVQIGALAAAAHDVSAPAIVAGDFNEPPGSFVYTALTGRGWVDTYLAAGNPECDGGVTGVGCTSGRVDDDLSQLESAASNENERIDYVFLIPPPTGTCAVEPAGDPDGDGTATRIFAAVPNPFAPSCGPAPAPICWPSDHEGAELDLECD